MLLFLQLDPLVSKLLTRCCSDTVIRLADSTLISWIRIKSFIFSCKHFRWTLCCLWWCGDWHSLWCLCMQWMQNIFQTSGCWGKFFAVKKTLFTRIKFECIFLKIYNIAEFLPKNEGYFLSRMLSNQVHRKNNHHESVSLQNRTYSCKQNGDCPIDKDLRCSCRHCRFKKCLKVGMDRTGKTIVVFKIRH